MQNLLVSRGRTLLGIAAVTAALGAVNFGAGNADAATISIRPIDFGGGQTLTGTVTTDGTVGALTGANFTDWNLVLTQVTTTTFTKANSRALQSDSVSVSGGQMSVANPDGALSFTKGRAIDPTMLTIADFTGASGSPGVATFVTPFEYQQIDLPLTDPNYVVANRGAGRVFDLIPIDLGDGYLVTGSITTAAGASVALADLLDWSFTVTHTEIQDQFTAANSKVAASQVTSDGSQLLVNNPDGYLGFGKPGTRHPPNAILADFTDPSVPGGRAGYYSALQILEITPVASRGAYAAAGADLAPLQVPEPGTLGMLATLGAAFALRRRARSI